MENQKGSSDGEDIPSDFFDDFAKEDFIEGLSVVDSWDDADKNLQYVRTRIKAEDLDKVDDLRDLIDREKTDDTNVVKDRFRCRQNVEQSHSKNSTEQRRSGSTSRMDNYIKPGSRRDPNKTNEAIKRDKEEKVKEHLAKHLESSDNIRPPGTELDDFFEVKKEVKKQPFEVKSTMISLPKARGKIRRESPVYREPVHRREGMPFRRQHWSPRRPHFAMHSPRKSPWRSPRRFSPHRVSPRCFSPVRNFRKMQRYSPRRYSPEMRRRKSRSPNKITYRRSRSRSPNYREREIHRRSGSTSRPRSRRPEEDDFLYPRNYYPEFTVKPEIQYTGPPDPQYAEPMVMEYPAPSTPSFPYPQGTSYIGYGAPYEYGAMPVAPVVIPTPQPVPAPVLPPTVPVHIDMTPVSSTMVPAPQNMVVPLANQTLAPQLSNPGQAPPADALAKLVADGILSHEDYLKLAPNKGATQVMDTQTRVTVLNRCNGALSKLSNCIKLPKRLHVVNKMLTLVPEEEQSTPKFCSPLKRHANMQFHFTKTDVASNLQRNKEIVDNIIEILHLENLFGKPKKKSRNDSKDAETQTSKPFCDVCEIRESTKFSETGTSIDREHISTSVHTQVVEHDLISSKAVFNPSGSIADGAPISIAHMTPAQLVSQLAARAKTLKNTDPQHSNQFRNPHYEGRGSSNQYHHQGNNYNYRY